MNIPGRCLWCNGEIPNDWDSRCCSKKCDEKFFKTFDVHAGATTPVTKEVQRNEQEKHAKILDKLQKG